MDLNPLYNIVWKKMGHKEAPKKDISWMGTKSNKQSYPYKPDKKLLKKLCKFSQYVIPRNQRLQQANSCVR